VVKKRTANGLGKGWLTEVEDFAEIGTVTLGLPRQRRRKWRTRVRVDIIRRAGGLVVSAVFGEFGATDATGSECLPVLN
jgi:hypothetical protein